MIPTSRGCVWSWGTVVATSGVDLIRKCAAGDHEAFAQFYDRYAPLAFALILRIVRERADAADVLQEVFWEAWQSAGRYDPERGSPEAWISTRARNRAIDRIRSIRRRGESFGAPLNESLKPIGENPSQTVAERAVERRVIWDALERLSESQREVIELAYFGGFTQTEIAEQLKLPLGTVKTRIRQGIERLREVVKQAT